MPGAAPTDRGKRAVVIGGSMSGLFAGLQLRARGFAVDIYERVDSELSGRGAGVEAQCPQTLTAWERLYRILRDAFPAAYYHRGIGLKAFEQTSRSVTARFTDGRSVAA